MQPRRVCGNRGAAHFMARVDPGVKVYLKPSEVCNLNNMKGERQHGVCTSRLLNREAADTAMTVHSGRTSRANSQILILYLLQGRSLTLSYAYGIYAGHAIIDREELQEMILSRRGLVM
jgi:hypothetical protein